MAGRFQDNVYNPLFLADKYEENIGLINRSAIRADYSAMRKQAMKRLKRFEGTEWENSAIYRFNKNRFKKLDSIKSAEELAHLSVELKEFLENPAASVTGQKRIRRERIETLHERGFRFVNASNFNAFAQFMSRMRSLGLASIYDSEQSAEIWNTLHEEGAPPDDVAEAFKQFQENNAVNGVRASGVSSDQIRRIWEKT